MTQRDFDTEDTVICLDVSRSMARKDFKPSRLEAAKEALIAFIRKKHDIDKQDRFALVTFSTNARILQELTQEPEQIINKIKEATPGGISSLGEGLAIALHVVSDQILKQGSNINRIIVISDGKPWLGTIDPLEKSRIMGEIGVIVDAIELSAERATWGHNILESIAILGEYHQVTNFSFLELTLSTLSHKKDVFELKKTTPQLHLIAADLLNPQELTDEILDAIRNVSKEDKCVVCRITECGICGTTDCGRLCPYCKTYIHLCCAKKWSKESKMSEANVFRCPHCLFLLRLPEESITHEPLQQEKAQGLIEQPKVSQKVDQSRGIQTPIVEDIVGDFFIEHGQAKLVAKVGGEEKTLYLSWDRWGSRDFSCNIMSGMNEIICKEFSPKINWVDRTCSGFVLRDVVGWFSQPSIDRGVFLLDLIQFENWCKIIITDVERIKEILATHPEITIRSDQLIDFEFSIDINYNTPIDTTNRNKLDQRLLEDAVRYLQLLRTRPYNKISVDKKLEIPKTPIEVSINLEPAKPSELIAKVPPSGSIEAKLEQTISFSREEPSSTSIQNPYTGKTVEIPSVSSKEVDIGTAKTLAIPKAPISKKKVQELPKIEISVQEPEASREELAAIQKAPPEKIKMHCATCQKWFEVEKFSEFPCPTCQKPLKLAIQCEQCKNWFSVSKPGKYACPKCKIIIDRTMIT
ncbi:MAG TPA: VWA domain-containing protein [Candidatus Deferrimicrobium sp.]|nr:VWA domain-containing protein [Candidatus Deferrimicrobium sp.]